VQIRTNPQSAANPMRFIALPVLSRREDLVARGPVTSSGGPRPGPRGASIGADNLSRRPGAGESPPVAGRRRSNLPGISQAPRPPRRGNSEETGHPVPRRRCKPPEHGGEALRHRRQRGEQALWSARPVPGVCPNLPEAS
jgi:hypothetical protein